MDLHYALALLASYLLGSVSGSLLLGRLKGVDIRRLGSGNAGSTNALRTQGKAFALATLVIDVGKGVLASAVIARWVPGHAEAAVACGLAAVIGHCFPVFFGFRGGKGAGTGVGVVLVLWPVSAAISLLVWLICAIVTGYVGLSTIIASLTAAVCISALEQPSLPIQHIAWAMFGLVIIMHHANVRRLVQGNESRFEKLRFWRR